MELLKVVGEEDIFQLSVTAKEIWNECYKEILSAGQIEYMTGKFLSPVAIAHQIEKEDYEYYFIMDDTDVVGFIAFAVKDSALFLSKLYVKKECRKRGCALFVMSCLESRCRKEKLSHIWLTVNVNNMGAINFYKKMGFYIYKDECTDIGNGYYMDDHFMKKDMAY